MKKLISALLFAASPAAAQVATSQSEAQLGGQNIQSAGTQAPTTGVECTEEMTATFCNVASGPSEGGYGSGLRVERCIRNKRVCIGRRRQPEFHPAMPDRTAVQ